MGRDKIRPCIYCTQEGKPYKMKLKPKHKKKEIEYEW